MSIQLMTLVRKSVLPTNTKFVLMALADWADDNGVNCYPSIYELSEYMTCSERTVQRLLRELEDGGWIAVVGNANGGGSSRHYALNVSKLEAVAEVEHARREAEKERRRRDRKNDAANPFNQGCQFVTPVNLSPVTTATKGVTTATKGVTTATKGVTSATKGVTTTTSRGDTAVTPSTIDPSKIHQRTANLTDGGETPPEQVAEPKFMLVTDANGREHQIPAELRYPKEEAKTHRAWVAYSIAYQRRYGVWPIWNASIGGRMSQLVDRVGQELAPKVAYHYVAKVEDNLVLKDMHSVALLLSGAEKWATQLRAGIKTPIAAPAAVNKQEALEARNRKVGEEWEAKMRAQMAQNGG